MSKFSPSSGASEGPSVPPRPRRYLRIGLIGHRKLGSDDIRGHVSGALDRTYKFIGNAFQRALKGQDHSTAAGEVSEVVLITSLAAGTDQLGAERFLAAEVVERQLEAILPFDRTSCSRLAVQDSGQPLEGYLDKARAVLELSDFVPKNLADEELAIDPEERRQREMRYVAAADILLRQADILIAVWDGLPGRGPGGTATTITLALREGLPVLRIDPADGSVTLLQRDRRFGDLQKPDPDPLFAGQEEARLAEIFDRLLNGPLAHHPSNTGHYAGDHHGTLTEAERAERYYGFPPHTGEPAPETSSSRAYERMLWLLRTKVAVPSLLNRSDSPSNQREAFLGMERETDVATSPAGKPERILKTNHVALSRQSYLLPSLPRVGAEFLSAWGHADASATWLSHAYRSSYVSTFVIGSLAVLIGLLGLLLPKEFKPFFVGAEILILAVAIWFFWQARRKWLHARYIDARHLAEQFRPSWALAQLGLAGRKVLSDRAPWTAWAAQNHIGSISLPTDRLTPQRLQDIATEVSDRVVVDQINYHRTNRERMSRLHHSLETVGLTSLVLAPIMGLGYILAVYLKSRGWALPAPYVAASAILGFGLYFVTALSRRARSLVLAAIGLVVSVFLFAWLGDLAAYAVSILMAALPALAAAVAGIRYHGDFERFSKRSDRTARELARIGAALADYRANDVPTFVELRDIVIEIERVLLSDIEDWRFVYAERPSPEP